MPLQYDPKTGVPHWNPFGEELGEGVTPKPVKLTYDQTKAGVFKGDKKLTEDEYEKLVDYPDLYLAQADTSVADKMLAKALSTGKGKKGKNLGDKVKIRRPKIAIKPGNLDANTATDSEIDAVEAQVNARTIDNWPLLRRLINRLRRAEGK